MGAQVRECGAERAGLTIFFTIHWTLYCTGTPMAASATELAERVRRLELALRELSERVEALERYTAPRAEHPSDRAAVRQKVTYDWQS